MNQEIFLSKKLQRILDLFASNEPVSFSSIMIAGRYKGPYSVFSAVGKLAMAGKLDGWLFHNSLLQFVKTK